MKKSISQIILGVYGIFDIIIGVIVLVATAFVYFGVAKEEIVKVITEAGLPVELTGVGLVIAFIALAAMLLFSGILARRAYRNSHHSLGIWILTLIWTISSAGTVFAAYRKAGSFNFTSLRSELLSFALNLVLFIAACCVRAQARAKQQ